MKAYSIFDDFGEDNIRLLTNVGISVTANPKGIPRPSHDEMKRLLEEFDIIIIGTSQKITDDMFEHIKTKRIIATASVGLDHINVPEDKRELVKIINTPVANAQSVTEYTMACALLCCKRLIEGCHLYKKGLDNKQLKRKPEDLSGKIIGVIGAGNISKQIMKFSKKFGMDVIYWTSHPEQHMDIEMSMGEYRTLQNLIKSADIISVNLPNIEATKGIIDGTLIQSMKENAIFISVSRINVLNYKSLFEKAHKNPDFYVCLDIDYNEEVNEAAYGLDNVLITPHIAGGTIETRKRMFYELTQSLCSYLSVESRSVQL